jgi:hypothetical protein
MTVGKVICVSFALVACCPGVLSCTSIPFLGRPTAATVLASARTRVYVSDFVFSPGAFTYETGMLPIHPVAAPGPLQGVVPRVFGVPQDPSVRARQLMDLMATSIRDGLSGAGFDARRLAADQARPTEGWLVRGTFTDMKEGNRLSRSLIGLGAGRTHFQVFVFIDELAPGAAHPAIALNTSAASARTPGALFSLNPIVAAATFVSCGLDLDDSVVETASTIAEQIAQRIRKRQRTAAPASPGHAQTIARSP